MTPKYTSMDMAYDIQQGRQVRLHGICLTRKELMVLDSLAAQWMERYSASSPKWEAWRKYRLEVLHVRQCNPAIGYEDGN